MRFFRYEDGKATPLPDMKDACDESPDEAIDPTDYWSRTFAMHGFSMYDKIGADVCRIHLARRLDGEGPNFAVAVEMEYADGHDEMYLIPNAVDLAALLLRLVPMAEKMAAESDAQEEEYERAVHSEQVDRTNGDGTVRKLKRKQLWRKFDLELGIGEDRMASALERIAARLGGIEEVVGGPWPSELADQLRGALSGGSDDNTSIDIAYAVERIADATEEGTKATKALAVAAYEKGQPKPKDPEAIKNAREKAKRLGFS